MQQDLVELLISIEADCRAQLTSSYSIPLHAVSLYLVLSLFSASQFTKLFEMLPKKIAWGQRQRRGGRCGATSTAYPPAIKLPHATWTRLCGTPININLSIKVIHYVALPHATPGNAFSTCLEHLHLLLPGHQLSIFHFDFFFLDSPLWQPSTNNKIFLGWAIKSLLLIAEGRNDLASG